jgi:hypothetical protein
VRSVAGDFLAPHKCGISGCGAGHLRSRLHGRRKALTPCLFFDVAVGASRIDPNGVVRRRRLNSAPPACESRQRNSSGVRSVVAEKPRQRHRWQPLKLRSLYEPARTLFEHHDDARSCVVRRHRRRVCQHRQWSPSNPHHRAVHEPDRAHGLGRAASARSCERKLIFQMRGVPGACSPGSVEWTVEHARTA